MKKNTKIVNSCHQCQTERYKEPYYRMKNFNLDHFEMILRQDFHTENSFSQF